MVQVDHIWTTWTNLVHACGRSKSPLHPSSLVRPDPGLVRIVDDATPTRYCYRIASTVGPMTCAVRRAREPAALPGARGRAAGPAGGDPSELQR